MTIIDINNFERLLTAAHQAAYNAYSLAKELRVSPRQLRRYTKKLFASSPQAWLDEQRMFFAAGMLKKHRSVKIVAFQLGFKQVSHFSRQFKLRYGLSPIAFLAWSDHQARRDYELSHLSGTKLLRKHARGPHWITNVRVR